MYKIFGIKCNTVQVKVMQVAQRFSKYFPPGSEEYIFPLTCYLKKEMF